MARKASREVIESFEAYLLRSGGLSDDVIRARMKDLRDGRVRAPAASSGAFHRALVPGPPGEHAGSVVVGRAVERAEPAADGRGSRASDDPRAARLRERHPVVRAPISFPEGALHAVDPPAEDVLSRIAAFRRYVVERVQAGEVPCVDLPHVHRANGTYDVRGNVFLGQRVRRLTLDRPGGAAFMRLLLTLETAADNLRDRVFTTKRGLYYQHRARLADRAVDQVESDQAIGALANVLGVRRKSLGFVEARRGTVLGRLVIRDGGEVIDLSRIGPAGVPVPRFTDDIEIVGSDADFVLVIEKQSIATRLAQARWWDAARCVIVCGEGFPSLSTREYVRALVDTLGIPALICVDADPGGVRVALTYAHGSISTALETPWLACDNIWWAGVHPSEIERLSRYTIRLDEFEIESARQLLAHPSRAYVKDRVRDELEALVRLGAKLELDALVHERRLLDDYLPRKVFDSELVKL